MKFWAKPVEQLTYILFYCLPRSALNPRFGHTFMKSLIAGE